MRVIRQAGSDIDRADIDWALADAAPRPFWLDNADAPAPAAPLTGRTRADLAVVGAGFSGLWTALLAKERAPETDVVVLEARKPVWAASGRNGGFCEASLTHGLANGISRWPDEIALLEQLGLANLDEIEAAVDRYAIDCSFRRTGVFDVATEEWQLADLTEDVRAGERLGQNKQLLDESEIRGEVASPTYVGAVFTPNRAATVDPARLGWGLRDACQRLGVRFYDHSPVAAIEPGPAAITLRTRSGAVTAKSVAWAGGPYGGPMRTIRHYIAPVYDYALVTEPLTASQRASIGWRGEQGLSDAANQFHYYRLTPDGRILWGGYDAIYHFRNRIAASLDQRDATFRLLAEHFLETFPQLRGIRFTHSWGGVIDTCTRFCAFFGTRYHGRLAYAAGYTGLGVGATRFGANVMLDSLKIGGTDDGVRAGLEMVRRKPLPFPPEPLRYVGIELTRRAIASADRDQGRRNAWLKTLDRLGLGFDS